MGDAYRAAAPGPASFDLLLDRVGAMGLECPAWADEQLRALRAPTLLIFGDRDFSPLADIAELFPLLPDAQLAILPGTTHLGVTGHPAVPGLVTRFLDSA